MAVGWLEEVREKVYISRSEIFLPDGTVAAYCRGVYYRLKDPSKNDHYHKVYPQEQDRFEDPGPEKEQREVEDKVRHDIGAGRDGQGIPVPEAEKGKKRHLDQHRAETGGKNPHFRRFFTITTIRIGPITMGSAEMKKRKPFLSAPSSHWQEERKRSAMS